MSKWTLGLGVLSWLPLATVTLLIYLPKGLPGWILWPFVPAVMLFAGAPFAAIAGTLLGCAKLLKGTKGARDLAVVLSGIAGSASFILFGFLRLKDLSGP